MYERIKQDLDSLSKDLYLKSPDLWIEFLDKVNQGIFDELVLFCAIQHNYTSIVEYSLKNNLINLNAKSKNRDFKNIYSHLLYLANQSSNKEAYNLLIGLANKSTDIEEDKKVTNSENKKDNNKNSITPIFICENCNSNVFEKGYIVCENKVFKFSANENKVNEVSKDILDLTLCATCKSPLENITHKQLESLCKITNCNNCNNDLREVGIIDKKEMLYSEETNSFTHSSTNFVCGKCSNSIDSSQIKYFNLDIKK